jgi:crossover junction endodeoxyribonuclease RusA
VTPLRFVVDGEPVPKGRARARVVGPFAKIYTPASTRAYESVVRLVCQAAVSGTRWTWTDKDRFEVQIEVYRSRQIGDADNFAKSCLDGMNGIAFDDDRHVHRLVVALHVDRVRPRVEVVVRRTELN